MGWCVLTILKNGVKVNGKDDMPYLKWKVIIHSCSKPPTRTRLNSWTSDDVSSFGWDFHMVFIIAFHHPKHHISPLSFGLFCHRIHRIHPPIVPSGRPLGHPHSAASLPRHLRRSTCAAPLSSPAMISRSCDPVFFFENMKMSSWL